jgi:hypothetical protein
MTDQILIAALLTKRPGWAEVMRRLGALHQQRGAEAVISAASYAARYKGRRAAMVFDAVASRRRQYERVVLPWVDRVNTEPGAASLAALSNLGPSPSFHLWRGEAETMREVAADLLRFGSDDDLGDDDTSVEAWAACVGPLEVAPTLDPYVGSVNGIGAALFCYLRMRAGADAIKPDVRVRRTLEQLGFTIPTGGAALLVVSSVLAAELNITRLVLDQLLWAAGGQG